MRVIYQGAWGTLILGVLSAIIITSPFFSFVAAASSIMTGIHSTITIRKHKRFLKGIIPVIIGMAVAVIVILLQAGWWYIISTAPQ